MTARMTVYGLKRILAVIISLLTFSVSFAHEFDTHLLQNPMPWYSESQAQQIRTEFAGDPRFSQLVPLLPKEFYIRLSERHDQFQTLIDQAFLTLSAAPSMKAICHDLLNSQPELIASIYGVSAPAAAQIASGCKEFKGNIETAPVKRIYPRKYVFIFSPDRDLFLDSWSNTIGNVYLFINPHEMNEERLLRILVHELAIALDFKEQLAMGARKSANSELPEIPSFEDTAYECNPVTVLRNPIIKYSFSAVRAFKFENKVMSELGFGLPMEPKKSCSQEFFDNLPFMTSIAGALNIEKIFNQQVGKQNTRCDHEVQLLRNSKLKFSDSRIASACEYLTEPQLSLWTFSATQGGPRPRIGNGWGTSSETREKQKTLSESLKKATRDGK